MDTFDKHLAFNFRAIQAKELGSVPVLSKAVLPGRAQESHSPSIFTRTSKVVTGAPKTLCLPRLLAIADLNSAFLVRHERPWDTYQEIFHADLAGEVIFASRRTHRSRIVAIRKYQRQDARRLIDRFGHLEHANVLRLHECYLHGDSGFFLLDDLPFTLGLVSEAPQVRPNEKELSAILSQVISGMQYLHSFGLTHQSLGCGDFLLGLDGAVKIARLELCVDCTPDQAEQAYLSMIPSLALQLMHKDQESEETRIAHWPIRCAASRFLAVATSAKSILALQMEHFIASIAHDGKELASLVIQLLCFR
ncbi:hypothetical protein N7478_010040 [Penicillium angulare]|uniref:uncharacterized protein n=1 Tax=Penicillium angulare TaxID=116970 RepID=UPI0025405319|nr:uncharacterized protein N7478_010040 [Penicillium angulare]KAJ5267232.1 hypothetical protein N7478_010040 [Penicillium angulare]